MKAEKDTEAVKVPSMARRVVASAVASVRRLLSAITGNLLMTYGGLVVACVGIGMTYGTGVALTVGGGVCFVAGALNGVEAGRR